MLMAIDRTVLSQYSWHPRVLIWLNTITSLFTAAERQMMEALACPVEVGSLHTLRLESINSFLNHSTNVLLTNHSFGKSVRTSTLCMTQVIFPTTVYRHIISLINSLYHNCSDAWQIKRNQPRLQKNYSRPPQVWFILGSNFQMPEGTTFICTNNRTQV
jgi:hypothetical protein